MTDQNPRKRRREMLERARHQDQTTDSPIVRALARDVIELLAEQERLHDVINELYEMLKVEHDELGRPRA